MVVVSAVKVTEIALIIIVAVLFVTNFIELCCFFYVATGLSDSFISATSHCRSDQLDRPDRPHSSTKLNRARPLRGRVCIRDLFPTESADVWSSSDRVAVELIGYWSVPTRSTLDPYTIISRSTRPLLDQYPITSQSLLERMATRSLYSTFWQSKIIV